MIVEYVRELVELSAMLAPTKEQGAKRVTVMRELRGLGFSHSDIWVLAGERDNEATLRKEVGKVTMKDKSGHVKALKALAEFAAGGHTLKDLDDFKEAKEITDKVPMTTTEYATLVKNARFLEIDILSLNKLSGEMLGADLKAKDVREGIKREEEMKGLGLPKEVQLELLAAARKFGDAKAVLQGLNGFSNLQEIAKESFEAKKVLDDIRNKAILGNVELIRQNAEKQRHKTYMDIFEALVLNHSFDPVSTNKLLGVAEKYGSPPDIIGAINAYAGLEDITKKTLEAQSRFTVIDTKKVEAEAQYRELEKLNDEANQVLGEIKANHDHSFRLQIISNLLVDSRRTQATPEELSRVSVAFLESVADCAKANPNTNHRFMSLVKGSFEPTILGLHNYLRTT